MPERPKFDSQTLKRLLSYMRAYKGTLVLVTVCILLSAVAGAASSMFLQKLIDGYIVPMTRCLKRCSACLSAILTRIRTATS